MKRMIVEVGEEEDGEAVGEEAVGAEDNTMMTMMESVALARGEGVVVAEELGIVNPLRSMIQSNQWGFSICLLTHCVRPLWDGMPGICVGMIVCKREVRVVAVVTTTGGATTIITTTRMMNSPWMMGHMPPTRRMTEIEDEDGMMTNPTIPKMREHLSPTMMMVHEPWSLRN